MPQFRIYIHGVYRVVGIQPYPTLSAFLFNSILLFLFFCLLSSFLKKNSLMLVSCNLSQVSEFCQSARKPRKIPHFLLYSILLFNGQNVYV